MKPLVEFVEFEPALEVAPQVMEWTTAGVRTFDLSVPPSHRWHALYIEMQPLEITDERAIVTITSSVYTVKRRRPWLAVGQCASLVAIFAGIPAITLLWNETLGDGLRAASLGILAGTYLAASAIKNFRG